MKYSCKFCNGKGKQGSGLSCICCKGQGFFDVTGSICECSACKGTGRATIRALSCLSCGGKGFSIKAEEAKSEEKKIQQTIKSESKIKELQEMPKEPIKEKKAIEEKILPRKKTSVPISAPASAATLAPRSKKSLNKKKFARKKGTAIGEEFGEEYLDSLKKSISELLESP